MSGYRNTGFISAYKDRPSYSAYRNEQKPGYISAYRMKSGNTPPPSPPSRSSDESFSPISSSSSSSDDWKSKKKKKKKKVKKKGSSKRSSSTDRGRPKSGGTRRKRMEEKKKASPKKKNSLASTNSKLREWWRDNPDRHSPTNRQKASLARSLGVPKVDLNEWFRKKKHQGRKDKGK